MKKALMIQGLSYLRLQELTEAPAQLLRQKAAGNWMEVALEVGAHRDWLIGNNPDRRLYFGLVEARGIRKALRSLPGYDQGVRGRDRYRGGARLTRVVGGRRCPGNDLAEQVDAIFVQDVDRDVGGRCTPVEDIQVSTRITSHVRIVRRRANPNVGRSASGTRRAWRAGGSRRTLAP